MKKAGLLIIMIVLGGQFSIAQLRIQGFHAVSDNNPSHSGVGISGQYSLYGSQYFLPGASVGVNYEFNAFDDYDAISIPLELIVRQYFIGRHSCCGGAYLEAMGGAKLIPVVLKAPRTFEHPKALPIASVGLGYRTGRSYDISFYYGASFEKNNITSMVGVKLGYYL